MNSHNNSPTTERNDFEGKELADAIYSDEEFIQETQEGFRQIEAGENSVFTLGSVDISRYSAFPCHCE